MAFIICTIVNNTLSHYTEGGSYEGISILQLPSIKTRDILLKKLTIVPNEGESLRDEDNRIINAILAPSIQGYGRPTLQQQLKFIKKCIDPKAELLGKSEILAFLAVPKSEK